MKVIKHGNTVKELTCPDCGCIFLAVGTDTCWEPVGYTDPSTVARLLPFFVCPECGHECREEDKNNEQA